VTRGDVVTVAAGGDFGKPRPAVVVQSDELGETDTVIVCLISSTLRDAAFHRLAVAPAEGSGLQLPSQIMLDKVMTVKRRKVGRKIGELSPDLVPELNSRLAFVLGLADPS